MKRGWKEIMISSVVPFRVRLAPIDSLTATVTPGPGLVRVPKLKVGKRGNRLGSSKCASNLANSWRTIIILNQSGNEHS